MTPTNTPLPDLSGLKKVAEAALNGGAWTGAITPQHYPECDDADLPYVITDEQKRCVVFLPEAYSDRYRQHEIDGEFIATFDPPTALALIAKVEALEGKEEESARAESVCAHPIASEPPLSAGDDAPTMQELRDSREWLSDLLTSVLNNDSRAEAVALLAYREFAK